MRVSKSQAAGVSRSKLSRHLPEQRILEPSQSIGPWVSSRRTFLKQAGLLLGAATVMGSGWGWMRSAQAQAGPGTLKWKFQTGGMIDIFSSPAIGADGTIYVSSAYSKYFNALDPDGTLKWQFGVGFEFSSPAVGADGTIYVASSFFFYALHPDGTPKWQFTIPEGVSSPSPAIGADGIVYVASGGLNASGNLYAIDPDGTLKWKSPLDKWMASSPSPVTVQLPPLPNPKLPSGVVYVASTDLFYAFFSGDYGGLDWTFEPEGGVRDSTPAVGADGTIYIGSASNILYALNPGEPDRRIKWRFFTESPVYSSPVIGADGTIYVGAGGTNGVGEGDPNLYALNPDGTLKWKFQTGSHVDSSPVIGADGTIYVGSTDGYLYALHPDGTLKWKFQTGSVDSSPVIGADGTIYVGGSDGFLYAIDSGTGQGLAHSSWPMFHHDPQHTGRVSLPLGGA